MPRCQFSLAGKDFEKQENGWQEQPTGYSCPPDIEPQWTTWGKAAGVLEGVGSVRWPRWCRSHTISWCIFCRCVCGVSCEVAVWPLTRVMDRPQVPLWQKKEKKKILCLFFTLTFKPRQRDTFMKTKQKTLSLSFNVLSSQSDVKTTSAFRENKTRDCEH